MLEDGTRVLTKSAIFKAFGRPSRGNARVINMPVFMDAKNLQPFISAGLADVINQIEYVDKKGAKSFGFNASILPLLCKMYLDARQSEKLTKSQIPLARASEVLLLGLSNIGIVALVDEATGYQYERERDELQQILKAYISSGLACMATQKNSYLPQVVKKSVNISWATYDNRGSQSEIIQ